MISLPDKWNWVTIDDPAYSTLLDKILNTEENLVILGPGGAGKSVALRIAYDMLPGNKVVLSTTGVSAATLTSMDVPATTIHSFFGLKPVNVFDRSQVKPELTAVMMGIDTLMIDEVGMLNGHLLDTILETLGDYRRMNRRRLPRIMLFGDVLQLPPVCPMNDKIVSEFFNRNYSGKLMFFNSKVLSALHATVVNLGTVYRQSKTDFSGLLNRVRVGMQTQEDIDRLNERLMPASRFMRQHDSLMYLVGTNGRVNALNTFYYDDDAKASMTYNATLTGDYRTSENPRIPYAISIAVGMQVMCLVNSPLKTYQNGTLGKVVAVHPKEVVIRKNNGETVAVAPFEWAQYKYSVSIDGKIDAQKVGTFTQIGCKPAIACTIWKAQGLTLDAAYIDVSKCYTNPGLVYMALSRCRNIEDIGLESPLTMNSVRVSAEALDYLRRNQITCV